MKTKHAAACYCGQKIGQLDEFELNEKPEKSIDVVLSIEGKKIYYVGKDKEKHLVDKAAPIIETPFGSYFLLRSELDEYKPDYRGWKEFKGTRKLISAPVSKETIERILLQLNGLQKAIMKSVSQSEEEYIRAYAEDPLKVIQEQNNIMSKCWKEMPQRLFINGRQIEENEEANCRIIIEAKQIPETSRFEELVRLNSLIEKEMLSKNYNKNHTEENTIELRNIEYLAEGDYSPAEESKIGQQTYEQYRGNLVIHKTSDKILDLLAEAKIAAARPGTNPLKTAMNVYGLLQEKYSDKKVFAGRSGQTNSLAGYMANGGVCIDKALTLQLALQEAGIPSRFARGRSGGKHAWVEADVLDKGKYALMLDPHKYGGVINIKGAEFAKRLYRYEDKDGNKIDHFNTIWRSKQ